MSASSNWKSHFTQIISGYDPVDSQGLSELGYALQHQQIPEDKYLQWARETFELASLDVKFFQSAPPPKELFEKLKDVYPWGPECLPIAEWEEHLLVAGLEKPSDLPPELNPIFLLAPIKGLLQYWSHFQGETSDAPSAGEQEESGGMPEGLSLEIQPQTQTSAQALSFSGIGLATPKEGEKTEIKAEPIALKIGENTHTGSIKMPQQKAVAQDLPINPSIITTPLNPKTPPPLKRPVMAAPDSVLKKNLPGVETAIVHTPPPQVLENTIPEIKAQPQILSPEPVANDVQIPESTIREAFVAYQKHYEKQLYVEYKDRTKMAKALYWPADFVASETPSQYSLQEDSFLSIVSKTQKPYHGYVVKNSVADKFFREVNSGQMPENVTLVPLIKDDIVVGALMGWGPKSTYSLSVLKDMEKIALSLCINLGWAKPEAA